MERRRRGSANEVILYDAAGEGVFAWVLTGWQSPVMVAASALPSDPVRARTGFAGDLTRSRGGVRADVHIWALVYFDLP